MVDTGSILTTAVLEMLLKSSATLLQAAKPASILIETRKRLKTKSGRSSLDQNGSVNTKMVMRFLTQVLEKHN